jgi:nucleoid-associated protein YgaU
MLPTHTEAMSMMEDKMMMDEKEGMMGEKDEMEADKDDMMADKDDMESDKDDMMADKDDMESDKDDMMADKDEMMADKDDGMMADDAMMDSIELMEDGPTPYTVAAGDTLGSIAQRAYGDSSYWPAICLNNSDVTEDCNSIQIGDEFMLPTKADAEHFMEEVNAMGSDEMEGKSEE